MPRTARPNYPHQYYHIFNRGFDRKNIFVREKDYLRFLEKLEESRRKFDWIIYGYCLLSSHYHIHAKTGSDSLSTIIHWLQTSHSVYFNKNHKRFSPVFTGRFKSILIQKDPYHIQVSKYIALNPVKAHFVEKPQDYSYSSYAELIGKPKHSYKIIDRRATKSLTGSLSEEALYLYRNYVEETEDVEYSPSLSVRDIIGTTRFRSQFE